METHCEHCNRGSWVEDERAGEQVVCPYCEQVFTAHERREKSAPLTAVLDLLQSELPDLRGGAPLPLGQPPAKRRKRQRSKAKSPRRRMALLIAAGGLLGCLAVALVVALAARLIGQQAAAGNAAPPGDSSAPYVEWRPDPTLLQHLGEPKGVDHFSFRLPRDFTSLNVLPDPNWLPRGGHFVGLQWQGPLADKAQLHCMIVTFPPNEPLEGGLEEGLDRLFGWLEHNAALVNVSHRSGEVGLLNGRYCIRASFTCQHRSHGSTRTVPREGVAYVMVDDHRQVSLYTLCAPDQREAHDIMGAALLTWHER